MLKNLQDENVDASTATVVEDEISSSSIILSVPSGDRTILYNRGATIHLHDATFDRGAAAAKDWLYLTHVQSGSQVIMDDILAIAGDPARSVGLTWNPGGTQIAGGTADPQTRALLAATRILLLNKEEAIAFTGAGTAEDALRILVAAGAGRVVITDGARGALAADASSLYRCPPLPGVAVIDATGAGDAFGTGVTWAILRREDLSTALRAGTILAASVLESIGAQAGLLTDTEMLRRLSSRPLAVQVTPLH